MLKVARKLLKVAQNYATLSQDVLKCSSQHKIALNCTVRFVRFKEILRGCRLWLIYRNFPSDMGPRDQFHKIMLSQKFDAKRLKGHFLYSTHAPCTPPPLAESAKKFFSGKIAFLLKSDQTFSSAKIEGLRIKVWLAERSKIKVTLYDIQAFQSLTRCNSACGADVTLTTFCGP